MIHLLVPGLLGPFPRFVEAGQAPRLPALERLLARGDAGPGGDTPAAVALALFGAAGASAGTAPFCYGADAGEDPATGWLLHAHPLRLIPDQDRLLALDLHDHPIPEAEAAAFAEAFDRHFGADGLSLKVPHPDRWYLHCEHAPDARFAPLADILGRNIDPFLPRGERAADWRALLNETQMLFFGLEVNAARAARGVPTIDGLWFSGPGRPAPLPGGVIGGIEWLGEESFAGGWEGEMRALLDGLSRAAAAAGPERLLFDPAPGRAVLDGDFEAWSRALRWLEARLAGLLDAPLVLYDGAGRAWHWRPAMRRRLWRRPARIRPAAS